MLVKLYNKSIQYFSKHPMLNSCTHFAVGFGIAIILQEYLHGDPFLSPMVGWALIIFSVIIHIRSLMK